MPSHLPAAQVCEYLKSYAAHFKLDPYIKLNSPVKWIKRNDEDTKWQVCYSSATGDKIQDFDRVAIATGLYGKPVIPKFEGQEKFKGKLLHVQAFKR